MNKDSIASIKRTCHFSWCPDPSTNYLVIGTAAGALDESFSNTTELEIINVNFNKIKSEQENIEHDVVYKTTTEASWSKRLENKEKGIIAGGMENGSLHLWDATKLTEKEYKDDESVVLLQSKEHKGEIRGLEFHPNQNNLLASGALEGEIFIWNMNDLSKPYTPGPRSTKLGDISDISWNNNVQHILASSSFNGTTSVWDLKNKREVMALSYSSISNNKYGVSSVSWHPSMATKLVTSSDSDENPVILVWDLRNANSPQSILKGHDKGIVYIEWCKHDDNLLLSCGKDNRTLCWNPNTNEIVKEFETKSNWVFEAHFNSNNPNLVTTSSFDGTISIYSLLTSRVINENNNDNIFEPSYKSSNNNNIIKQPPKWLKRPIVAKYGFNNKFVSFSSSNKQTITINSNIIRKDAKNEIFVKQANELHESLDNIEKAKGFCDIQINNNNNDLEVEDYKIIKLLFEKDARKQLIKYLNFNTDELEFNNEIENKPKEKVNDQNIFREAPDSDNTNSREKELINSNEEKSDKPKEFDELFQGDDNQDNDFFNNPEKYSVEDSTITPNNNQINNDKMIEKASPFRISANMENENNKIAMLVLVGNFEKAVELCIVNKRYSDALILANCGGSKLVSKTQSRIIKEKKSESSYIRLIEDVINNNLEDVVVNANLEEWDKILVMICTYARGEEFGDLCETLGNRLTKAALKDDSNKNNIDLYKNALVCYLIAGNIEKVIKIWIKQSKEYIEDYRRSNSYRENTYKIYNQQLDNIIKKITLFAKAINYTESLNLILELLNSNNINNKEEIRIIVDLIYMIYYEYGFQLVNHGEVNMALNYLKKIINQDNNDNNSNNMKGMIVDLKDRINKSLLLETNVKMSQRQPEQQVTNNVEITNNNTTNFNSNNFSSIDNNFKNIETNKDTMTQNINVNNNSNSYGWNDPPMNVFSKKNNYTNITNKKKEAIYSPFLQQQQQQNFNNNNIMRPNLTPVPSLPQNNNNYVRPPPSKVIAPPPKTLRQPQTNVNPGVNTSNIISNNNHFQHRGNDNTNINNRPYHQPIASNSNIIRPVAPPVTNVLATQQQSVQRPILTSQQYSNQRAIPSLPPNTSMRPQTNINSNLSSFTSSTRPQTLMHSNPAATPPPNLVSPSFNIKQSNQNINATYVPSSNASTIGTANSNYKNASVVQQPQISTSIISRQSSNISNTSINNASLLVDKTQIPDKFKNISIVFDKNITELKNSTNLTNQNNKLITDIERKLNVLYEMIIKNKINEQVLELLVKISKEIEIKNFQNAKSIYQNIVQNHFNAMGSWATAIKNLIQLSERLL